MSLIKNWMVTGDCHGGSNVVTRLKNIKLNFSGYKPEETAVIILGDAGLNFYLNKTDSKYKKLVAEQGYILYCVRGNHEERPENLGYHLKYDANVGNMIYQDPDHDNIKYFVDGGNYVIDSHPCLVIGGAYSVDKWYRLQRAANACDSFTGWFKDEQLTEREMRLITDNVRGKHFDFVLTHTCPLDWQPTDLFLGAVDQSTVDSTMEVWMNQIKDTFDWNIWCFGHYHADRIERPHIEQFYTDYEPLNTIWNRWNDENTYSKSWWLPKSPFMEQWDKEHEI